MIRTNRLRIRAISLIAAMVVLTAAATKLRADQTGMCGAQTTTIPFDDVLPANEFFCSIAEAYFSALANGTSATTYSPSDSVSREQMAAFITRTMDQALERGSRRAALDQYWTTLTKGLAVTIVGDDPRGVKSDGADLWVANHYANGSVSRVRASDGKLLETWTGATNARDVLCAMGKVFVSGDRDPGVLYQIDPAQSAGPVTILSSSLGAFPQGIAYDGEKIWIANFGSPGLESTASVSIITLNPTSVTTVTTGFSNLSGATCDGSNVWVTDIGPSGAPGKLHKLDSSGAILSSSDVGIRPQSPMFDGSNIWVPNNISSTLSVVRATGALSGTVLATLSGNGLEGPNQAAFDGERILVTNYSGNSVSLWKATDLTPIGWISTGTTNNLPFGACSDGLNFWITFSARFKLARF